MPYLERLSNIRKKTTQNHAKLRDANAILVCTLQAPSLRYRHFTVMVLTSIAGIKLWRSGVYSTKKDGVLLPFKVTLAFRKQ